MNNQEALTRVWKHFIVNNGRFSIVGSSEEDLNPKYYGNEGARCPVGLLMDKRDYNPDFEGTAVEALYDQMPSLHEVDVLLLAAMQLAHDNSATDFAAKVRSRKEARRDFKRGLIKIAKKFELVVPRKERKNG